ncbi:MAG: hypothetical protein ACE14M_06360 [Terriglobales bacterium]
MKVHLLYRDQDFNVKVALPWNKEALTQDLALNSLFNAMAQGDAFVSDIARKVILSGSDCGLETIPYRQKILEDCLNNAEVVRELYALAVETSEVEKKHYFGYLMRYPDSVLRGSIERLELLLGFLKKLRKIADFHASTFLSEGWTAFFTMLQRELTDEYFVCLQDHLEQLKFRSGVLLSARLGKGNKGRDYVLHVLRRPHRNRWEQLVQAVREQLTNLAGRGQPLFEFSLDPRDESGYRALTELRDRGISLVATALAQSTDHVRSFFAMLQTELAFYIGCLNLHELLLRKGEPACFPVPVEPEKRRLSFRGLYDVALALTMNERVVDNDADADNRDLVVITGANQGGKSTFLRSVGLAQLMMQCGMFVPADSFCSSVCDGLLTHYKREEDPGMKSGKLDEELSRMSDIVDHVKPHSMVLFNESFAATNEREGSEIARQIVSALIDNQVRVLYVTHLYEFAHGFSQSNTGNILFLRAECHADGTRTFKLVEGAPLQTSFGDDLYKSVFANGIDNQMSIPSASRSEPGWQH